MIRYTVSSCGFGTYLSSCKELYLSWEPCRASNFSSKQQKIYRLNGLRARRSLSAAIYATTPGESIDREDPANDILLFMLQAGSFPFFLHAHITVRQKITIWLQKNYGIKYMKPQRNATCEFFVSSPGNFTMIRTSIYIILKNLSKEKNEIKGECVMKWTVSLYKGQRSFSIQFPSVRLKENCSPEEQKEIYKGFE